MFGPKRSFTNTERSLQVRCGFAKASRVEQQPAQVVEARSNRILLATKELFIDRQCLFKHTFRVIVSALGHVKSCQALGYDDDGERFRSVASLDPAFENSQCSPVYRFGLHGSVLAYVEIAKVA